MRQVYESQQAFIKTLMCIRSCMVNINDFELLKSKVYVKQREKHIGKKPNLFGTETTNGTRV